MTTQDTEQSVSGVSMTDEVSVRFESIHDQIMEGFSRDANRIADMYKLVSEYVVPSIEKIAVTPTFRMDILDAMSIQWRNGERLVHASVYKDQDGVFDIVVLYTIVKVGKNAIVESEEGQTLATYNFDRIAEFLNCDN